MTILGYILAVSGATIAAAIGLAVYGAIIWRRAVRDAED